jgi:hypothetical protein
MNETVNNKKDVWDTFRERQKSFWLGGHKGKDRKSGQAHQPKGSLAAGTASTASLERSVIDIAVTQAARSWGSEDDGSEREESVGDSASPTCESRCIKFSLAVRPANITESFMVGHHSSSANNGECSYGHRVTDTVRTLIRSFCKFQTRLIFVQRNVRASRSNRIKDICSNKVQHWTKYFPFEYTALQWQARIMKQRGHARRT